jgi:beta-lactamase superfamily II metal-dependent hydrolase
VSAPVQPEPDPAAAEPASEDEMEAAPAGDEDADKPADPLGDRLERKPRPKPGHARARPGAAPVLAAPERAARLRVHFIDIGQGDATLVECPNGNNILVDAGSHTGAEARASAYVREAIGADGIDDVVITHPDSDHYNALPELLAGVSVGELWMVGEWSDYREPDFRAWLQALAGELGPARVHRLDRGEDGAPATYHEREPNPALDCGRVAIRVLAAGVTGGRAAWRKNTMSIVLLVSDGDLDVLLTGDATLETERRMMQWYGAWLESEVLKLGHHGSALTSTGPAWAAAVRPQVAIASATFHARHGHPARRAVERLHPHTDDIAPHRFRWWIDRTTPEDIADYREAIYSTAVDGHIVVESDGDSYWVLP